MHRGFIVLALIGLCSFDSSERMSRIKIAEDMSIYLPKGFRPMDDLDFGQRYPSVRKPIAAFTNEERLVDFSVNTAASQWREVDIEIAQKFFKAGLYNLFDNVEMIEEGIVEIHGKRFVSFEFESRVKGDGRDMAMRDAVLGYTYIQYLVESDRTLVFSFNCPRRMKPDWQETAHKIMKSIKVK